MEKIRMEVSAPGKVILFGEHSVVYGKLAVAASLDLKTTIKCNEMDENQCDNNGIFTLDFGNIFPGQQSTYRICIQELWQEVVSKYQYEVKATEPNESILDAIVNFCKVKQWPQHIIAVLYVFTGVFDSNQILSIRRKHYKFEIITELSVGAGTGSSASYSVCLAALFLRFHHTITSSDPSNFEIDRDLVCKWAFCIEKIFHGNPSGVDNAICTYGGLVAYRKTDNGPKLQFYPLKKRWPIILINTKISRNTKQQVEKAANLLNRHPLVIQSHLESMDLLAQEAFQTISDIDENTRKNGNISEDFGKLESLTALNQGFLQCLNVSHPKIELACRILQEFGFNGKLTGAGGGGYVICLVPPNCNTENVLNVLHDQEFGAVVTELSGDGVHFK